MSWQDEVMIEQEQADALFEMGESEWLEMQKGGEENDKTKKK